MRTDRPPMGWNSWDAYGTTVTEVEVLQNARIMADRMLKHGWDTIVIDAAWFDPIARSHGYNEDSPFILNELGRQTPDPARFPSSAGGAGFGPLAETLHGMGLKLGLHMMRGIPRLAARRALPIPGTGATTADIADLNDTCAWNSDNYGLRLDRPAAQKWVDLQVARLASWGIDYLKADDMLAPYDAAHIDSLRTAVTRSGRDITISLSPGTDLPVTVVDHVGRAAHLWRISDDVWYLWGDVVHQLDRLALWARVQGEQGWADADMLPLGRIGLRAERGKPRLTLLTLAEQRSLLTLWCIARSPLMMGGDLPTSPDATLAMLTHAGVLRLHHASYGARQTVRTADLSVWTAMAADDNAVYAGVFHLGDEPTTRRVPLAAIHVPRLPTRSAVDVWSDERIDLAAPLAFEAHGCRLLRFDRGS